MTGIETVFVIHYTMFIGLIFYNLFLKAQLKDYRANEKAKKGNCGKQHTGSTVVEEWRFGS